MILLWGLQGEEISAANNGRFKFRKPTKLNKLISKQIKQKHQHLNIWISKYNPREEICKTVRLGILGMLGIGYIRIG